MIKLGPFLKDVWLIARPYFHSEEKWSARLLLGVIILLNLSLVGMDVVLNFWNGAFYDSLQNKDWRAFVDLLFLYHRGSDGSFMPGFSAVAAIYIIVAVYRTYLNQWLQIRWRRWLTRGFIDQWLSDRAYYRISLTTSAAGLGTDNPDQRIAEDLRSFVGDTLSLGLDLLSNIVSLISFVGILWSLSGSVHLLGVTIGGYMVWVALIYAIIGTWLTHLVGRPLATLSFRQQRFEADFRFSLVRLRENVEGIALYGGEEDEHAALLTRFSAVVMNWWAIMQRTKLLNALTSGYQQIAVVFPIIVAAPRYFGGQIPLGGLTRTASAFGQVQGAMSWFVGSYASLAAWSATVERLASFQRSIEAARAQAGSGIAVTESAGDSLDLHHLHITLPNGKSLIEEDAYRFLRGESVVISGRSGLGKSTLFRAIAGIWPFGEGKIARPQGSYLFLPQRPYLPLGSLRHVVTYPAAADSMSDEMIAEALRKAGLGALVERLGEEHDWSLLLSGGEQQRLAIARALLIRPDWLFLDEATSNLDPEAEAELYQLLKRELPGTTVISIAHNPGVAAFHDRKITLSARAGQAGTLREPTQTAPA
ncbi:MAG: ABC transporter ATP-binding protein/permease [Acidibrevibacterium sp.]|jgi:putative ATP-binding cassette transporter|uniref:ABC transporter ATP-binding protein/permease n=1 Tax=Acidibrevibacterium fodinaquatile TaxID=1969806 RepID=UPI0023A8228B|nr:ABC transporter ATP-binding protein/permease [Acidibrevibacterium fodinaquatile]MCA7119898.1 ABC transporter ATP-binding protein/permease [Acidibrevibacterium fodinaquatile]